MQDETPVDRPQGDRLSVDRPSVASVKHISANPASRVTVIEQIVHAGENMTPVESRYNYAATSGEQPYLRYMTVGEEWISLDTGWLNECSLLMLKNDPQKGWGNPTPEEKVARAAAVIDLQIKCDDGIFEPITTIRPNQSIRISPPDLSRLWLRCRKGNTRVVINIFPI